VAKRFTDTDKWDDDWFLGLPPRFKCVWEYLRDTCSGVGIKKISFTNISNMIKEPITREDFDQYIGDRVQWINHETVWIHGFIVAQYKKLSPHNRAHINIAKLALRETEKLALSPKAQNVANSLYDFIQIAAEAQAALVRGSNEPQAGDIGNRKQEIGNRKELIKGEDSKNSKPPIDPFFNKRFDNTKLPQVAEIWNEHCGDKLTKLSMTTKAWNRASDALLDDYSPEQVTAAIKSIAENKFLTGGSRSKWKATFSWLIKGDNLAKVLVGDYDNEQSVDNMLSAMRELIGEAS
jgi:hypothetical protein